MLSTLMSNALHVVPADDREQLRLKLKGVQGVYALVCMATGQYYIGSSVNVYERILTHLSPSNIAEHPHYVLVQALLKHGTSGFMVVLVATTPDKAMLRRREQAALDKYAPAYNKLRNVPGYAPAVADKPDVRAEEARQHSVTVVEARRAQADADAKAAMPNAPPRRVRSEASRAAQSVTMTGAGNHRYGRSRTDEDKEMLRQYALNRTYLHKPGYPVMVVNVAESTSTTYRSRRLAAKSEGYGVYAMTKALREGTPLCPNVYAEYAYITSS